MERSLFRKCTNISELCNVYLGNNKNCDPGAQIPYLSGAMGIKKIGMRGKDWENGLFCCKQSDRRAPAAGGQEYYDVLTPSQLKGVC